MFDLIHLVITNILLPLGIAFALWMAHLNIENLVKTVNNLHHRNNLQLQINDYLMERIAELESKL